MKFQLNTDMMKNPKIGDFEQLTDNNTNDIVRLFPHYKDEDIKLEELEPAPDAWNFFPKPDAETANLIIQSIYSQGQLSPALVWKRDDNKYMILGGHTRFAALKFLNEEFPEEDKFFTMRCHVYDIDQIDEETAKFIIIMNNMTQRAKESTSVMIKSVCNAMELEKKLKKETWGQLPGTAASKVGQALGINERTAYRYYRLRNLIPEFVNLLDDGAITQSTALSLSSLHIDLQQHILSNRYYDIKDSRRKDILKADSIEKVEEIVRSDEKYLFDGKVMRYALPQNFKKFSLAVPEDDKELLKIAILEAISTVNFNDKQTKEVLTDILNL